MDNGFEIGAETRTRGNVAIVSEKSFMDYLFVEIIFIKKFRCKDYTHHDYLMLLFSSIT